MAAAACSATATAPDAAPRVPAGVHENAAAPDTTPTTTTPAAEKDGDGGAMGSGVGR